MGPPAGRISSATAASTNPGRSHCSSGSSIRVKIQSDRGDDCTSKKNKYECNFFRPDPCDTVYKASSMALMRSRAEKQEKDDDQAYLEGCRRVVDFMCALWRDQKMCDITIRAKDDNVQVSSKARIAICLVGFEIQSSDRSTMSCISGCARANPADFLFNCL